MISRRLNRSRTTKGNGPKEKRRAAGRRADLAAPAAAVAAAAAASRPTPYKLASDVPFKEL